MSAILVDVDDVVFDLRTNMCEALSERTGRRVHYSEWTEFDFLSRYDISNDEFVKILIEERLIERCVPEMGAREALVSLREAGNEIIVVTARGWHPNGYEITKNAFDHFGIPFDQMFVTKLGQPKSYAYSLLDRKFSAMIDDSPKNLVDARQSGLVREPVLVERPWNVSVNEFSSFKSLADAGEYFVERSLDAGRSLCFV